MFITVGILVGFAAAVRPAAANEDRPDSQKATARSKDDAAYSKGKSGSRLKWLSQRSEKAVADEEVTPVQYAEPILPSPSKPTPAAKQPYYIPRTPPAKNPNAKNGSKRTRVGGELEHAIKSQHYDLEHKCPSPKELKRIEELTTNIAPSEGDLPQDCPLGNDRFEPRSFSPTTYTWTASALCHKPLYFEDVQLERYGHMCGPWLQPFASGVNFFLTIPILPYKMGLETPNECMYTLGYYRPGDCSPYLFDPLPLSVRAAFFEAGAWAGGWLAF